MKDLQPSLTHTEQGAQKVAGVIAEHLSHARSNRKATKIFAQENPQGLLARRRARKEARTYLRGNETHLFPREQERLQAIRDQLANEDYESLSQKAGQYTQSDRISLLLQAKFSRSKNHDEKQHMYREAGYADIDAKLTGKKLLLTTALGRGMSALSHTTRVYATMHEKMIPLIDYLPDSPATVGASLATYVASYAYSTYKNLEYTKKMGTSANALVTSIYSLGDKLLPDKVRDRLAVSVPVALNTGKYGIAFPIVTLGATGEPKKVIAGSLAVAGVNMLYAAAAHMGLREKKKGENKPDQNTPTPLPS